MFTTYVVLENIKNCFQVNTYYVVINLSCSVFQPYTNVLFVFTTDERLFIGWKYAYKMERVNLIILAFLMIACIVIINTNQQTRRR